MLKRIGVILLALFVVFAMVGCKSDATTGDEETGGGPGEEEGPGEEGPTGPSLPVLFENGRWLAALGTVTVYADEDWEIELPLTGGKYQCANSQRLYISFENPVDLSAYKKAVFSVIDNDSGWCGGLVFFDGDTDDNVNDWSGNSGGKVTLTNNVFTFNFETLGATAEQLKKVSGFDVCTGNALGLTKAVVTN